MNPNVQAPVYNILAGYNNVHLIKPLDYQSFISLLKFCYLVLTDSGGIQEEAPSLGKPVLLMRESTERPEGLDAGCVKLIGANFERITSGVSELLDCNASYDLMSKTTNPYGDGKACKKIISVLKALND